LPVKEVEARGKDKDDTKSTVQKGGGGGGGRVTVAEYVVL
jgi:hypothetical protein